MSVERCKSFLPPFFGGGFVIFTSGHGRMRVAIGSFVAVYLYGRVTFFLKSKEYIIFNIILVDFIEICDLLRILRVYR